jgi:hypothetical protein
MRDKALPSPAPLLLTAGPEYLLKLRHGEITTVLAALEFTRRGIALDPQRQSELAEVAESIKRQRKEADTVGPGAGGEARGAGGEARL